MRGLAANQESSGETTGQAAHRAQSLWQSITADAAGEDAGHP
jgi:hypothetical protein